MSAKGKGHRGHRDNTIRLPQLFAIAVLLDGKETIYASAAQGSAQHELLEDFRREFGYQNVRVVSELESRRKSQRWAA